MPAARDDVLGWMAHEDLETRGIVYELTTRCWSRISPALSSDEHCNFASRNSLTISTDEPLYFGGLGLVIVAFGYLFLFGFDGANRFSDVYSDHVLMVLLGAIVAAFGGVLDFEKKLPGRKYWFDRP